MSDPQPDLQDTMDTYNVEGTQEEPQPEPSGLQHFLHQPDRWRFEYQGDLI